jgi:hypothetical protein
MYYTIQDSGNEEINLLWEVFGILRGNVDYQNRNPHYCKLSLFFLTTFIQRNIEIQKHHRFCYCIFFYPTKHCSACHVPPDAGLQKKPFVCTNYWDRTLFNCVARSGSNHRLRKREDWTLWRFFLSLLVDHIMTKCVIVI